MPGRDRSVSIEAKQSAASAESSWGEDNSAKRDAAQNDLGAAQQSAVRSATEDRSQGQRVGFDAAQSADRVEQQKAEDAELSKRWPEISEAAEAALKERYQAVREQAERARQAVESSAMDLEQRFAQAAQDLSTRQAQDMAAQQERDPGGAQQLQSLQEQERQNLQAELQRKNAELGEARQAIEREVNGARRDVAESRVNGPREDQDQDQDQDQGRDVVETLSQREDNLVRLEQERTEAADRETQQSTIRSAEEDQSQGQRVGVDVAQSADRVEQQKAEDAELLKRWPEVSEAAEAALKEQYQAVREQAERARQAVESAAMGLEQRFAQASQDLSNRQAQDMAVQQERDPGGAQQLQALPEQERQNLQAEFQRKNAELGEARQAIEREVNGARRDVAESRVNGPREDQALNQGRAVVEKLSQREDNLVRLEQERTQAADRETQQSAVRSAEEDQSQGQRVGVDVAQGEDRVEQQKAEDAELLKRWPEVSEAAEAALKEQYQAVREQAERSRLAVESAATDLEQRVAQAAQDLYTRQAQDIVAQQERDPGGAQQLHAIQEQERQNLQAEFQRKNAELGEARQAIEREVNGARRDVAEARANGPREDQDLDRDLVERLSQREDNLARLEQERTQAANNEAQQSAIRSANEDWTKAGQLRNLNDQDKTLDANRADVNRRLEDAEENNRQQLASFEALRQEIETKLENEAPKSRERAALERNLDALDQRIESYRSRADLLDKVSNLIEQQRFDLADRFLDLVKLADSGRRPARDEINVKRDKEIIENAQLRDQSGEQINVASQSAILDRKFSEIPEIRELWKRAAEFAKQKAKETGDLDNRNLYDLAIDKFKRYLVNEKDETAGKARALFEKAGFRFLEDERGKLKKALPILRDAYLESRIDMARHADLLRISGQHLTKLENKGDPLDPNNLAFQIARDNMQMDAKGLLSEYVRQKVAGRLRDRGI